MSFEATEYPTFQPAMRQVISITTASNAVITTSFDHQFIDGLVVRLYIPKIFGMSQANGRFGEIRIISSTEFTMGLDTTFFDLFVIPPVVMITSPVTGYLIPLPPYRELLDGTIVLDEYAQVVPLADVDSTGNYTGSTRNVLPYP